MANFKIYNCNLNEEDFFKLYHPQQRGGAVALDGSSFFKASTYSRQRGHGIGGIFGAIGRRLLPFIKQYVLPHAATAVKNVVSDVYTGKKNWKDSLKHEGINALKGIGASYLTQSGSGVRRRRKSEKRKPKKRKKRTAKKRVLKRIKRTRTKKRRVVKKRAKRVKRKSKKVVRSIFDDGL